MPVTFLNAASQEQSVSSTAPMPTQAIDGYTSATAYVATINGGATPVALATAPGKAIDIFNNTGADLEYARNNSSVYFPIPNGTSRLIVAITNASQIKIRRLDRAATVVTPAYEVLS